MHTRALIDCRDSRRIRRIVLLGMLFLFVVSLCQPAAARDVRIGLTELKPSLYTDDQGKPAGFLVDVLTDMATREDWNIIWVSGPLSESWDRLNSSQIDLMPGVADTPDREVFYDFSHESALSVWSQVYARPGSGISTILDLDGKRIAMVRGSASGIAFKDYAGKFGINATFLELTTPADVYSATAKGTADALIVYNTAGQENARTYGLANTPVMFNPTPLVFAVQKGKNRDLILAIDREIAEGKRSPSSAYNQAMQRWFGITSNPVIPPWILWGLGIVILVAVLFVIISFILRREVGRKTAELSRQNLELQAEVSSRKRAEEELVRKNDELQAAYEEMTATEEELRENYQSLRQSEQELTQARKKLTLLNTLTIQDVQSRVFSLAAFFQLARTSGCNGKAGDFLSRGSEILHAIEKNLAYAKKYQDLGISKPRWQKANHTLLTAISHLDLSAITRTMELGDLEIYADPLLEDVFFTLMDNVISHGAGATVVDIRYRQNPDRSITILVTDNGPGIPAADKEKIFTWEYREREGRGLFLAREILSITGIAIAETGEAGKGARFEITVPESGYRFGSPG